MEKCGDGFCTHNENASTCPGDCLAKCGDTFCTHTENVNTCPVDCPATCGDGFCTHNEDAASCTQDCKKEVLLRPDADTFLRQGSPDVNYGTGYTLYAGSGSVYNGARRTILQFDLSQAGCKPKSGHLYLYFYDQGWYTSPTLYVLPLTAQWAETQATWNKRTSSYWSNKGGDYSPTVAASLKINSGSFGWKIWDISALVTTWYNDPASNYGLILKEANDHQPGSGRNYFRSRSTGYTNQRPALQIVCAP